MVINKSLIKIFIIFIIFIIFFLLFYFLNNNIKKIIKRKENFENNYVLPKVIYGYWDNLDGNDLIKAHINTWHRNISSDWKINIISKKNILDYVDIDFYNKYKDLPSFRFSDFLRLYILNKYGGVWIDASTIIINDSFLNQYHTEMIENKYDVLLYEFKSHSILNQPYFENWFIMAPQNSIFIIDLYNQFSKAYDMDFVYYKNNILKPEIDLTKTLKDGDNVYLMQHAIIHYLLKYNTYKINSKDASESMFKAQNINKWDCNKLINYILMNNDWTDYYAIKLVSGNRKGIKNNNSFIQKLNSL